MNLFNLVIYVLAALAIILDAFYAYSQDDDRVILGLRCIGAFVPYLNVLLALQLACFANVEKFKNHKGN